MLAVLSTIGSLVVVAILIVAAIVVISVVTMAVLAALAGSMANWRALRRRFGRRGPGLRLRLSHAAAPARLRAPLSGGAPRVSRRFSLSGERRTERVEPRWLGVRRPQRRGGLREHRGERRAGSL
jgi:hypothetical protein